MYKERDGRREHKSRARAVWSDFCAVVLNPAPQRLRRRHHHSAELVQVLGDSGLAYTRPAPVQPIRNFEFRSHDPNVESCNPLDTVTSE